MTTSPRPPLPLALIVDDDATFRMLSRMSLEQDELLVEEAVSGEAAIEFVSSTVPDIIILDWVMEGMSGIDLMRMIRTNPQSPNPFVPVIMLSGHTSIEHVQKARDAGVNEFIAKPVSVKTMMTRMAAVIEHPRPYVRTSVYFGPCRRRRQDEHRGPERRAAAKQAAE